MGIDAVRSPPRGGSSELRRTQSEQGARSRARPRAPSRPRREPERGARTDRGQRRGAGGCALVQAKVMQHQRPSRRWRRGLLHHIALLLLGARRGQRRRDHVATSAGRPTSPTAASESGARPSSPPPSRTLSTPCSSRSSRGPGSWTRKRHLQHETQPLGRLARGPEWSSGSFWWPARSSRRARTTTGTPGPPSRAAKERLGRPTREGVQRLCREPGAGRGSRGQRYADIVIVVQAAGVDRARASRVDHRHRHEREWRRGHYRRQRPAGSPASRSSSLRRVASSTDPSGTTNSQGLYRPRCSSAARTLARPL